MNDISLKNLAQNLDLTNPPEGFVDDPFPFYDALLEYAPILRQPDGSVLLSRHADLDAIYRNTTLYSSDKEAAFGPKFGVGSPSVRSTIPTR